MIIKKIISIALLLVCTYTIGTVTHAASLSISPSSGSYEVGDTISVSITLDTEGEAVQAVDLNNFTFDETLLEVIDFDSGVSGVQITPGTLMGSTNSNVADNDVGTVTFAQAIDSSNSYTGSGVLAQVSFTALAAGTAAVDIDFTLADTTDSNVAQDGSDILDSVAGASYTITEVVTSSGGSSGGGGGGGGSRRSSNNNDDHEEENDEEDEEDVDVATDADTTTEVTTTSVTHTPAFVFKRNLTVGDEGEDVRSLQKFLNISGYLISVTGPGSRGQESNYFGLKTQIALARYQEKFRSAVLTPAGVTTATGYFGPSTRVFINAQMAGDPSPVTHTQVRVPPTVSKSVTFTRDLKVGMVGEDVRKLQQFLNSAGFKIQAYGSGSAGQESTYFGLLTQEALAQYQNAHRSEVLTPVGLTKGSGFFGAFTRKFVNAATSGGSIQTTSITKSNQDLATRIAELLLLVEKLQTELDVLSL